MQCNVPCSSSYETNSMSFERARRLSVALYAPPGHEVNDRETKRDVDKAGFIEATNVLDLM